MSSWVWPSRGSAFDQLEVEVGRTLEHLNLAGASSFVRIRRDGLLILESDPLSAQERPRSTHVTTVDTVVDHKKIVENGKNRRSTWC